MKPIISFATLCAIACLTTTVRAAEDVQISPDVVYDHKFGLAMTMDVLKPKNANGAAIVFLVSGAWHSTWFPPEAALSKTYPYAGWFDCRPLFDKGFTVFIVRHGSGEKFLLPEIVDDVRRSVRFIRLSAKRFGVDPERLGALGASAGGHLALMLATTSDEGVPNPRNWDWYLRFSDRVAAVVAYFPPTDIRSWFQTGKWKEYEAFRFDPALAGMFSPLLFVSAKSAPALLLHGDKDTGVPIEHSETMLAEYKKNNVPCELLVIKGAGHGFNGFVGYAEQPDDQVQNSKRAREATVAWFEKQLAPRPKPAAPGPANTPAAAPKSTLTLDYVVADLSAGPAGPWPVSELAAAPPDVLKNDDWRTRKLLLRRIPAGTFRMGSSGDEAGRKEFTTSFHMDETRHTVTLTKPFYIGVFPVTQAQWSLVMGGNPSWFKDNPKRPVESVSWNDIRGGTWPNGSPDAGTFIGRLNVGTSQSFDLPTEARWEYSCRAGTVRAFNDQTKNGGEGADCSDASLDPLGWYENNSERGTHDVGGRQANAWGLYDMHGNVSQWCLDWYAPYPGDDATDPPGPEAGKRSGGRVLRGGYWSFPGIGCRSAARDCDMAPLDGPETHRYSVCGFRLVLSAGQ
ncbi:MAG: SUMF1/EgtB/PvdO family nonheme iron enzyme [Planctomycetota bacterium]|nr:SUMF1/EgtB/PvdO family nonheme iron enzyme [Planctomycetota bacterium]